MNKFTFSSHTRFGSELDPAAQYEIKREPMLFTCNLEHAVELGGALTSDWMGADLSIDSRVHMLMPGWFPCIPGWHHDDVPRERADGQPNYVDPSYHSEHIMALFGDASLTEFAIGTAGFDDVPIGSVFYREWHSKVEEHIRDGKLSRIITPESRLINFDAHTWHQGTPATKSGWRFFIRATRNGNPKRANELRQQTQVYMPAPMAGW